MGGIFASRCCSGERAGPYGPNSFRRGSRSSEVSDPALWRMMATGLNFGDSLGEEPGGAWLIAVQRARCPPAETPPTTIRRGSMPSSEQSSRPLRPTRGIEGSAGHPATAGKPNEARPPITLLPMGWFEYKQAKGDRREFAVDIFADLQRSSRRFHLSRRIVAVGQGHNRGRKGGKS